MTTGHSGKHATYELPKPRRPLTEPEALQALISAARRYTASREACPFEGWQDRIEQAGWYLAEAVRAYDKAEARHG